MEPATKSCWLVIAAINASPSAVLFRPALTKSLYGIAPERSAGILLVHRVGLFLAVFVVAISRRSSPTRAGRRRSWPASAC
jgi:hypothetical protein